MPGGSISRPEAWSRLLFEIDQTTSIETVSRVPRIAPEDPALFEHPFAALVGDGELEPLSDAANTAQDLTQRSIGAIYDAIRRVNEQVGVMAEQVLGAQDDLKAKADQKG